MDRKFLVHLCKTQPEKAADILLSALQKIEQHEVIISNLEAKVKELEARLNKNSSNSSKPPSSDGYKKPLKNNNSREQSGKKPGGQIGHKGNTLQMSDNPDKTVDHYPVKCLSCKNFSNCKENFKIEKCQVHDIIQPALKVTEHRVYSGKCPKDGLNHNGFFPDSIKSPVSYGPLIQSFVVLVKDYQFIPYGRLSEFMKDVFGVNLSQGSIANFEKRCAGNLTDYYDDLAEQAKNAEVLHVDETGLRITKMLMWLHVYSNDFFTYYKYHKNRGKKAIEAIGILINFHGSLCHDFWSPYFSVDCDHAMCNAHLLREMIAMIELYGEVWSDGLIKMLLEIKKEVDKSPKNALSSELYEEYKAKWLKHIQEALDLHPPPVKIPGKRGRQAKGKVRCLLERLFNYVDDILRFAKEEYIPFDNNLAERDLRMIKAKQKISGCFRSEQGANAFCIIRSYISTLRKQGRNIFEGIQEAIISQPRFLPAE